MKKSLITRFSALTLTVSTLLVCIGCSGSPSETSDTGTSTASAEITPPAQTTVPHRDIVYPDTFDFSDEDAIADLFWMEDLLPGISTTVNGSRKQITQTCTIAGTEFSLTVGLT